MSFCDPVNYVSQLDEFNLKAHIWTVPVKREAVTA